MGGPNTGDKYAHLERERPFVLARPLPAEGRTRVLEIADRYLDGPVFGSG